MVSTPEGPVFYVCTKLEADSSILSKVIRGSQNLEIGSHYPGHAHLGVALWSALREDTSSMSAPNLKRIALDYSFKSYKGPKISKLSHVTLSVKFV